MRAAAGQPHRRVFELPAAAPAAYRPPAKPRPTEISAKASGEATAHAMALEAEPEAGVQVTVPL